MADHHEFPPGFRFYPTEEELVSFYLRLKLQGSERPDINGVIPVVDVFQQEPWHLPEVSGVLCHGDSEQWFYFVPRHEREARGGRPNRTTASGYWKATGSPSYVYSSDSRVIGVKRTMVFYRGKAPTGGKTKWKMNEYRAIELHDTSHGENPSSFAVPKLRHEWSLCRVYVVSGSFRAFDRRPLRPERGHDQMVLTPNYQANLGDDHAVTASSSVQNTKETRELNQNPASRTTSTSTTRLSTSTSLYPHATSTSLYPHGQDVAANATDYNIIGNGNYWALMSSGTGDIHFD